MWATRIRLFGVVGAAFFSLFTWTIGMSPVDSAGVLAAACFVAALIVEAYLSQARLERTWYEGRAAAESVKTLSWRYAVGGEPFNIGMQEPDAANRFVEQLRGLFAVVKDLNVAPSSATLQQITQRMRDVRALPLAERKAIYEHGRVEDQQNWYQQKAAWNKLQAARWTKTMIAVEVVGVIGGVWKAAGAIEGGLLSFTGVIVASVATWLQTKQHRTLATAYTITGVELGSLRSMIAHQSNEADWAKFVSDAEEAFSREHTLWNASRRLRSL